MGFSKRPTANFVTYNGVGSPGNVWILPPGLSLLSLGIPRSIAGAGPFLSPQARWILAMGDLLRRLSGGRGLHRGGDAARRRLAAKRLPGLRSQIAYSRSANGNYRQSLRGEFRGARRALLGRK